MLDIGRTRGFAWCGGVEIEASPPLSAVRRQADIRRRDGERADIPRRFRPRLAAGFDDAVDEGLSDFDRMAPRVSVALMIALAALFLVASFLSLLAAVLGG
ncbi:hypothetical protein OSH08_06645 [Kaistia geumhonensis]|uniref:DUF2970 domain-containing protein n=1 Tax=Kaistia geumhonensis TaxID=410839 RepID=A0ABU0M596_9HYPH|nr:hypothetical protein [Kaistia geumhonensis]MCX5478675.1 hypothetical protein [Kaistia geumhonensis]MDQ0516107.1 hypothetical protein [Kaistia geumhonensis]